MVTENPSDPDVERLNAFVDGELTPAERAPVAAQIRAQPNFARAHATLARLKASVGESADATPAAHIVLEPRRRHTAAGLALSGMVAAVIGLVVAYVMATDVSLDRRQVPLAGQEAVITLAGLPADPVIPRLDMAGLVLEDIKIERVADVRLLLASYRGPHGCLLDLRISPAGTVVPAHAGSSHHSWEVASLAYELVAHGMPGWRFAVIADAAERETREGRPSFAVERRLREARAAAPPCTG
jgi:hypothetical protein